jgi:hypothetical protein
VLLLGCLPVLMAACSSSSPKAPTGSISASSGPSASVSTAGASPGGGVAVGCGDSIARTSPSAADRVFLGSVGFAGGMTAPPAPGGPGSARRYFAKQGLMVRAGTTAQIRVVPATSALVQYGTPGTATTQLTVSACPPGAGGDWSVFAGGYLVTAPACLTLQLRSGGRTQDVRVAVGRAC